MTVFMTVFMTVGVAVAVPGILIVIMIVTMLVIVTVPVRAVVMRAVRVRLTLPVRVGRHQMRTKSSPTDVVELPRTLVVSSSRSTAAR